ncbi:MAG: trypsin-like peptidase domain-containing protein [Bacteroidota bacterium]
MRLFRCLLGLACCLLCLGSLSAQYRLSATTLNKVPEARMPAQDNATLLAAELAARRPGRANAFAVTLPVKIRPEQNGLWTLEGNALVWRQRISSPGAKTLNLGFGEFNLPAGAELYLVSPEERLGPFTPADNEDHNQLWTPVVRGDELLVELRVPPMAKDRVQLYLTSVNHDFEDITKLVSGECNVDVVCGSADGWPIVDRYRDIIRSVAAYTINGRNTCTGFLVNNVNQDGTPLFMTADHCGVTAGRAPSMVAYWNYQNSNCRRVTPGTGNESGGSNGRRNIFNSGSTLLATFPNTDFTLLLLDDPVVDAANAFFAGWSAEAALPQDTVVCIHHPGVQEKRISFSFQQVFRTFSRGGNDPDPNGNHLEVPDWDIGTTEGGSSGSPIFDRFGRVRGQLFGGDAACNNDFYDVYGFFHSSWTGGGTPDSRLMDWLDPCGTGQLTSMASTPPTNRPPWWPTFTAGPVVTKRTTASPSRWGMALPPVLR